MCYGTDGSLEIDLESGNDDAVVHRSQSVLYIRDDGNLSTVSLGPRMDWTI